MPAPGDGPELSEEGRRQAEQAAEHVASLRTTFPRFGGIYSSPLARTRQTAAALGKALDLIPVELSELVDCDAGQWAGMSLKTLAKAPEWPNVQHHPSGFSFPGGEAIEAMSSRVVRAVKGLVQVHLGQSVVVVSHADPIKAVLADALGMHLDLFQRIIVNPASVSAISYSSGGPSVILVNWPGSRRPTGPRYGRGPRARKQRE